MRKWCLHTFREIIKMNTDKVPFIKYERDYIAPEAMIAISQEQYHFYNKRRSIRDFSDKPIPKEVIENIIAAASTAPSGANKQPWSFCVVTSPKIKREIRIAAEKEEFESYHGRMSEEWLKDLEDLGTDWNKPFLEIAPALIVIFRKPYEIDEHLQKKNNYYVNESVGLASGFLLTVIHKCGLVALTHTPSPMNFLAKILDRPENEKPFLLIPIGYPSENCEVPNIRRKPLDEICFWYE
jgi:iodotyrosine deiodinase